MTSKVEIIGDGLAGPYKIKINDTWITDVESYELVNEDGVHKFTITLITDNFQLKRSEPQKPSWSTGTRKDNIQLCTGGTVV